MSDRLPGSSHSNPFRYRGFNIVVNSHGYPAPDYVWYAEDFDGADDSLDTRCGWASTVEECKREIDEWIEEHKTAPQ